MTPTHPNLSIQAKDRAPFIFSRSVLSFRKSRTPLRSFLLVLFCVLGLGSRSEAQTTVFTDDFNSDQSVTFTTSGTIGASVWSVARSGADFGARRNTSPAQLELTNDASANANANGWVLVNTPSSSFAGPYNTTLNSNPGLVTWTFNMRQVRGDP